MKPQTATENSPLLAYLFKCFPDLPKIRIKQTLKFGSVLVNGKPVTSHKYALRKGDKIEFRSKTSAAHDRLKADLSFPVIYEDTSLIVINKPSGLLTMGTDKDKIHTAYFELTDYVRAKDPKGRARIFIVHRLDRDASGLVVFAKTEEAKEHLQKNWADAIKKYYAIVEGSPVKSEGRIESYLVEDDFRRVYSANERARDAKHAVTLYRVLKRSSGYSLLEATLVTGRKHQIRVHLADLGHPIVGDDKYGKKESPIGRLGLHAFYLSFKHPVSGEQQTFKTELPNDF